jgi:N-acetylglucosaminyldiphosphoundecaprenol N-acetyl-beta-D-mannosaminyltransferase
MTVKEIPAAPGAGLRCRHEGCVPSGTEVNGVRFDPVSPEGLLTAVDGFLTCGKSHVVHFFAGHPTVLARRDADYRAIANRGDLNVCDGASVAMALRLFGVRVSRIVGAAGMGLVSGWGLERGLRHYFYGGTTPEVLERLIRHVEEAYPGIEIVGAESPPFGPVATTEVEAAAERMRKAGADVVWVGLGVPKQDIAGEALRDSDAAPVILCVGAAFDFVSGVKRRAPSWMQRVGLEWLFRLLSEPRRLWRRYLLGNPAFVAGVLVDWMRFRAIGWRVGGRNGEKIELQER